MWVVIGISAALVIAYVTHKLIQANRAINRAIQSDLADEWHERYGKGRSRKSSMK